MNTDQDLPRLALRDRLNAAINARKARLPLTPAGCMQVVYSGVGLVPADIADTLHGTALDAVARLARSTHLNEASWHRHANALALTHIDRLLNREHYVETAQAILASRGSVTSWWARKLGAGS